MVVRLRQLRSSPDQLFLQLRSPRQLFLQLLSLLVAKSLVAHLSLPMMMSAQEQEEHKAQSLPVSSWAGSRSRGMCLAGRAISSIDPTTLSTRTLGAAREPTSAPGLHR